MSRKNRRICEDIKEISEYAAFGGYTHVETKRGVQYQVSRTIRGRSNYKCPSCNNIILSGKSSVTVIEVNHFFGSDAALDDRRHWHDSCWRNFQ
ncbi:MAG: hypothetical protein LBI63_04330 [Candidatus Ancillula sp.]|jgi:hypothetical protein|nr:hypothetical protein [Candidatus Ancillula sp.]